MISREHEGWFWKVVDALAKSPIVVGNFEIKFSELNDQIEMVEHQPNPYYGKEKDYVYRESHHAYYPKRDDDAYGRFSISESCFKNKTNLYTIMVLNESSDPLEYNWRTIGNRPFKLDDFDLRNIKECIEKLDGLLRDMEC